MRAAEPIQLASPRHLSLVGSIGLFGIAIVPATPRGPRLLDGARDPAGSERPYELLGG
jgi:hypothetical protein